MYGLRGECSLERGDKRFGQFVIFGEFFREFKFVKFIFKQFVGFGFFKYRKPDKYVKLRKQYGQFVKQFRTSKLVKYFAAAEQFNEQFRSAKQCAEQFRSAKLVKSPAALGRDFVLVERGKHLGGKRQKMRNVRAYHNK